MAEEKTGTNTVPENRTPEQKVADLVRACLLSVNEEISSHNLDRDFATMVGYHIPYKKFGFLSLESYFESLSDINLRRAANGSLILSAGISKNTEHIFHLIAQQKQKPAKRRVHKLKKRNFRAGDDGDEYAKWMEPRDSDDGFDEVYVKSSPQPNAGAQSAPPKRENSSPNYRRPASMPPCAGNHSYRAPDNVQKPSGSRYVGRNFDPNYHQRFKGPDSSPRFASRGPSPNRSADRGNFGAPRFVPRGRSPGRSVESDTSLNFEKDLEQESVIDAAFEKTEESPEVLVEREAQGMVKEINDVLKINDETDVKATDGIGIAEGAEPKVEEEPFGPKKFLMLGLASRQKEMEQRQAELAKKYNRECADFLDKTTTLEEYTAGKNFSALQEFLKIQGMPSAELKIEVIPPKYCEITIHLFVFCGFPEETQSLKERLEEMAADAMGVLRTLDLAIEKDINEPLNYINRILMLVYAQPSGIWRSYVSKAYSLKYNEEPPENWADTFLDKVQDIAIVRVIGSPNDLLSEIWKPKLVTLTWKQPEMISPTVTSPAIIGPQPSRPVQRTRSLQPAREYAPSAPCVWAPSSPAAVHLEQLQLAPRKSYPIVVNNVGPEASLWVRVAGGELGMVYDRLLGDLANAYADHAQVREALVPTVGCCYAAFVRFTWHRVMLTHLQPSGMATVFLLDVGHEEVIPFYECRSLPPQYTELPGLAVCCVLDGFEEFSSNALYLEFLNKVIVNGCFVAEVLSTDSGKASVNLTGTGNLSGLEVNYHIADKLGLAIPTHRNLAVGQVLEVRMPHVTMSGSVFVRIEDDAQKLLHLMSHQLEHKLLWQAPKPVREVHVGSQIYFARLLDTENSVYRVIALAQPSPSRMICVNFIDLGDKAFVPLSCLFELEGFFDSLWRLPPQAIMVSLTSLPPETFTKQMLQRLQELVPADKPVLMKVVGEGLVPEIELFRRLLPENILVSVNNTLALDPTLHRQSIASPSPHVAAMSADTSAVTNQADQNCLPLEPPIPFSQVAGQYMLQPPNIPPVGAQFDVHVPMVSNPNNFIVQPWNSYYCLQEMMFELQQVYTGSGCENCVAASEITPGLAYAALHPDGSWYRVSASSQVINEDTVLASFSDYGDLQVLQLTNMRHLAPRFCQLPCQAIRAHLYGVKPLHHDWSVEDCLAFQALVNEQQFVSIVRSKPADVDGPQEESVGLKLIDTSGADDVHIDQLLVDQGRAEFIN